MDTSVVTLLLILGRCLFAHSFSIYTAITSCCTTEANESNPSSFSRHISPKIFSSAKYLRFL